MKVFILAAGLGTRLKPFTNHHPKALAMVNGESLLERNIHYLQKFGLTDIVVNVHHFADQIVGILKKNEGFGSQFQISDETNAILETGGGLKKAAPLLKDSEPVLMINVDILSDFNFEKMLAQHKTTSAQVTLAVQKRNSSRALFFDDNRQLCGWKNLKTREQKPPSLKNVEQLHAYAFSGISIIEQSFIAKINRKGKFSITDVYLEFCATEKIMGWNHTGDSWLDVGKPEGLAKANEIFGRIDD